MVLKGKIRPMPSPPTAGRPEEEWQISNAFDNQFQLPVLFYVGCSSPILFGATMLEVLIAFAFVGLRYAHAIIHITENRCHPALFRLYGRACRPFPVLAPIVIRLIAAAVGVAALRSAGRCCRHRCARGYRGASPPGLRGLEGLGHCQPLCRAGPRRHRQPRL